MKHEPITTANALSFVAGFWYVLCVLWVVLSQNSYMGVIKSWFRGVDFSFLPPAAPNLNSMTIGLITFVGFAWISGYFFATCYNKLLKR